MLATSTASTPRIDGGNRSHLVSALAWDEISASSSSSSFDSLDCPSAPPTTPRNMSTFYMCNHQIQMATQMQFFADDSLLDLIDDFREAQATPSSTNQSFRTDTCSADDDSTVGSNSWNLKAPPCTPRDEYSSDIYSMESDNDIHDIYDSNSEASYRRNSSNDMGCLSMNLVNTLGNLLMSRDGYFESSLSHPRSRFEYQSSDRLSRTSTLSGSHDSSSPISSTYKSCDSVRVQTSLDFRGIYRQQQRTEIQLSQVNHQRRSPSNATLQGYIGEDDDMPYYPRKKDPCTTPIPSPRNLPPLSTSSPKYNNLFANSNLVNNSAVPVVGQRRGVWTSGAHLTSSLSHSQAFFNAHPSRRGSMHDNTFQSTASTKRSMSGAIHLEPLPSKRIADKSISE